MTSTARTIDFLKRTGGYEICTALLGSTRTRQQLITMIDRPERTIDRRLDEGESIGIIDPVPTTTTELTFTLNETGLPEDQRRIIDSLALYFNMHPDQNLDDLNTIQLRRNRINDREPPTEDVALTRHADTPGGSSTFLIK